MHVLKICQLYVFHKLRILWICTEKQWCTMRSLKWYLQLYSKDHFQHNSRLASKHCSWHCMGKEIQHKLRWNNICKDGAIVTLLATVAENAMQQNLVANLWIQSERRNFLVLLRWKCHRKKKHLLTAPRVFVAAE